MGGSIRASLGLAAQTLREQRTLRKERREFRIRLGLPAHPTQHEVVEAVGRSRGLPIRILHLPLRRPLTGGLLHTPDELILLVDRDSPKTLQAIVIGHELAHIYLGHDPEEHGHDLMNDEILALLAPALNPAVSRMMLGRTYFDVAGPGPTHAHPHAGASDSATGTHAHGGPSAERQAEILGRLMVSMIVNADEPAHCPEANSALRHRGTGV
ncbi:ImmA/IrrE family metallo-endopeptidase [Streptomyces sp. ISL-94]|uniref:ImmA/IrrE family metallo-endopeptidase n=1 Tax=Streptomyces sp. ISL-94 TaxID=2819190 RepID=UPI001BE824E4|nr:ImmA/IrrE family metallo-endopeptidase [Streptomyces sp. ISL-94]MBT2482418.1 ImmA/IrrE family metallo-endopeptidase [Streptomyces sp. ISL-94]